MQHEDKKANMAYIQNRTLKVICSHRPVSGIPYCAIVMRMMPMLITLAGMKRDSEGSRNDFLKEPGLRLKRSVIRVQLRRKRTMLNIKNTFPMASSPLKRYGTNCKRLIIQPQDCCEEGHAHENK